MRKNSKAPDPFFFKTDKVLKCQVLLVGGVNIQRNVEVEVSPQEFGEMGEKVVVPQITCPLEDDGLYQITLPGGRQLELWGRRLEQFPAGGAANTAIALMKLGDRMVLPSIVAAVGGGNQGRALTTALVREGVELGLVRGAGTNFTMAVQGKNGSGRTVLLCEKNSYVPPAGLVKYLSQARPAAVGLISIRPDDFALADQIVATFGRRKTFIGINPHADLLNRQDLRERLLRLLVQVEYLQVNRREAALLLGKPIDNPVAAVVELAATTGAALVVITLDEQGVVAAKRVRGKVLPPYFQLAYDTKAVDTAGAGDVFFATLLYYLEFYRSRGGRSGVILERALDMAAFVAAKKVAHRGPTIGIPTNERREAHLWKNHK